MTIAIDDAPAGVSGQAQKKSEFLFSLTLFVFRELRRCELDPLSFPFQPSLDHLEFAPIASCTVHMCFVPCGRSLSQLVSSFIANLGPFYFSFPGRVCYLLPGLIPRSYPAYSTNPNTYFKKKLLSTDPTTS